MKKNSLKKFKRKSLKNKNYKIISTAKVMTLISIRRYLGYVNDFLHHSTRISYEINPEHAVSVLVPVVQELPVGVVPNEAVPLEAANQFHNMTLNEVLAIVNQIDFSQNGVKNVAQNVAQVNFHAGPLSIQHLEPPGGFGNPDLDVVNLPMGAELAEMNAANAVNAAAQNLPFVLDNVELTTQAASALGRAILVFLRQV